MKKYKKRIPLISPQKTFIVALCSLVVSLVLIKRQILEELTFITIGVTFALIFISTISGLATMHKYVYTKNCIIFSYLGVKYCKIDYHCIKSIIISNAVYNDSKYDGNIFDYPLYFKKKGSNGKKKIQYPYITLSTQNDKSYNLEKGMNNRRVYYLDTKGLSNLGICWFDSLIELLLFTEAQVYLLEDVYDRFKTEFDEIITRDNFKKNRINIVSSCG